MADADDIDLNAEEAEGAEEGAKKKSNKLALLLPNLLKFVAIGLAAVLFIVTIVIITFNILNKNSRSQTVLPEESVYNTTHQQYQWSTIVGTVRATTRDPVPWAVTVDVVLGYQQNNAAAQAEIVNRQYELRDFIRNYFSSKRAEELTPENEITLKQEIIERLNTRILTNAKILVVTFNQLSVSEM
ncbi:MAG: flagellar basal body-associated FliL family protein [Treponema sp.]|jgi:flagellar FliL protein|nr:flagellar basal body-associated FliL family protein [Treponema sp.]